MRFGQGRGFCTRSVGVELESTRQYSSDQFLRDLNLGDAAGEGIDEHGNASRLYPHPRGRSGFCHPRRNSRARWSIPNFLFN